MYTSRERIKELCERFNVTNGRLFAEYRFSNLNWYLGKDYLNRENPGDWFCYGDIQDEDIPELMKKLENGEVLKLGWKNMGPDTRKDQFFHDGGGLWIAITTSVVYDCRRDGRIKEPT